MPAPIKIRASYSNDSQFLLRLKRAIEKDNRLENELKGKLLASLDGLVINLISADVEVRKFNAANDACTIAAGKKK